MKKRCPLTEHMAIIFPRRVECMQIVSVTMIEFALTLGRSIRKVPQLASE